MHDATTLPPYCELHCLSNYSFLRGASHPEELVARAAELGYGAIAITDECSVAGVVRAHVEARKQKLPILIGASFTLRNTEGDPALSLVILAQTRHGYGNLCELITLGRCRAPKGSYLLHPDDIADPGDPDLAHLKGLPECVALLVPEYGASFERLLAQAEWTAATFPGRCWMSLTLLHRAQDERHKAAVMAAARHTDMPVVATGQVQMHLRSRKPLHDTLAAVRLRKSVQECGFERAPNAEQHLRSRLRLANLYPRATLEETLEVAIVRPGPIQGGMVHPYLRRRQKQEPVTYPSADVRKALERTLGIPIFQEQVMQVAMLAAGFTAGEADELRRSMAAWRRKGGLGKFYDKIINGMTSRGYDRAFAEQIFLQIQGFGEYGFPESHSASFALLAYASSWLKCHEPEAFLLALLNSQPMGFYSVSTLVQDAQRHGVQVLPVDATISHWEARLEFTRAARPAVRLGFNQIKGMQRDSALRLAEARSAQPFTSVADMAHRAGLNRHDLHCLAASNALRALAGNRRSALWESVVSTPERGLLREAQIQEPEVPAFAPPNASQSVTADFQTLRLTLDRHPLSFLREQLTAMRFSSSAHLRQQPDRRLVRACGIVTVRQRPGTSKGVIFITLEDEEGQINLIVRPHIMQQQRQVILTARLLGAYGSWQSSNGVHHLIVGRLVDLTPLLGNLETKSRDFH